MNFQELCACVVKELRLLSRDLHGLALLFIMPAAFILVMSLALKDQFETHTGKKIIVTTVDEDHSAASQKLIERLDNTDAFELRLIASAANQTMEERLRANSAQFALVIGKGYAEQLGKSQEKNAASAITPTVTLEVAADAARQTQMIVAATVRESLGREGVDKLLAAMRTVMQPLAEAQGQTLPNAQVDEHMFQVRYAYSGNGTPPTAVQQNVPAWLVFAIFFVVIPVSNAVIRERQVGTLRRIRTTRVGNLTLLLGKLIPYFVINQVQVIVMLLIGMYVVPRLGGDALALNGSLLALSAIAGAISIAALGYALLIAVIAKTTEQATIIGGAGNIILAAIGGIMVPKFIMPVAMQKLAGFSPMSWGLDGFLDVLLRNGNAQSVLLECLKLITLGVVALFLAGLLQARARD